MQAVFSSSGIEVGDALKILLANKYFFMNGGSESVFFQERDFLMREGHHVVDFSMQDPRNLPSPYAAYFVSNVEYKGGTNGRHAIRKLELAASLIHNREAVRKLRALIEHEKPDLAHLHNIYHQLTPSIIGVLKKAGIPVVMTLHDYKLICPTYLMVRENAACEACCGGQFWRVATNRCHQGSWFGSGLLALEGYWHRWLHSYDAVDLFLAPSRFLLELVQKYRGVRVRLLHNGVNLRGLNHRHVDKRYAIYFGRISREKGVEVLLRAHDSLQQRGIAGSLGPEGGDFSLKVVGTGPILEELRSKYPAVEFCGFRSGNDLFRLVGDAAFVVVPSLSNENFSMSVLEAMALGKPVIASRMGGLPEQVQHGETGLLVDAGDVEGLKEAMAVLMRDPRLRRRMGESARRRVEHEFSSEVHGRRLLETYSDVLETRSLPSEP